MSKNTMSITQDTFDKIPASAQNFIKETLEKLERNNVALHIVDTLQVDLGDGIKSSGFFEDVPLRFAVATGKKFEDWFMVFVHEYGHFTQYMEDKEKFSTINKNIGTLFSWVDGKKELSLEEIKLYSQEALWLEYDCEKRALKIIQECKLTDVIDPALYAQKANSYFNFYHYVAEKRAWYKAQQEPYNLPEVYELFSKELTMQSTLSDEQRDAYQACIDEPSIQLNKKLKM